MDKLNCWEVKKCGREPGGANVESLGKCTASIHSSVDGINDGKNGGRNCWVLEGTLCGGKVKGTFAVELGNCMKCNFYKQVREEEGSDYVTAKQILDVV